MHASHCSYVCTHIILRILTIFGRKNREIASKANNYVNINGGKLDVFVM
jgi:hypothetical protein